MVKFSQSFPNSLIFNEDPYNLNVIAIELYTLEVRVDLSISQVLHDCRHLSNFKV